jgi:ligand-binding sensor domain-containing protein
MFPIKYLGKFLNVFLVFILLLIQISSCKKDDPPVTKEDTLTRKEDTLTRKEHTLITYSSTVHFDITGRMLEGKHIDCIEPDNKGNTWVSSDKDLYYFKNGIEVKKYTLGFPILDISIAGDETLWIGTNGGGLGHLSAEGITWYTLANSSLPRDYINNVEVGLDGRVWFSSAAYNLGGLVVYDGNKFSVFTPENSILNQHVISDIGIDHNGSLYVVTSGTVTKTNIYRISGNSWECLGNNTGTFYWVFNFTVSPAGIIYLLEDFSFSSSSGNSNTLYEFTDNVWKKLSPDFMNTRMSLFTAIEADRMNYCWLCSIDGNKYVLHVFDGKSWQSPPSGLFLNDMITTIEADSDNKIWIGTSQNGVFILKQ